MKTAIIIPARYASSRYPGKPLVDISLPNGERRSLIRLSWDAAKRVEGVDQVHVATDDARIADHVASFGANVIMTSPECQNGTERCAEALLQLENDVDCIVNLQGDAPLTPAWFVEALIGEMSENPDVGMATPVVRVDQTTYRHFREDRKADRVGGTTAVLGKHGDALYFSKEVLPWLQLDALETDDIPVWHHVGVYAYRPDTLRDYMNWGPCDLENLEGLEQLRFLYNAAPVRCVPVDAQGRVFWELNNPADVARIEAAMKRQSI